LRSRSRLPGQSLPAEIHAQLVLSIRITRFITEGITKQLSQNSVVSAKIPKKMKQELEKSGINVSQAIRKGLETALKEKKIEHLEELLKGADFSKLTKEQIVRDIRQGREERAFVSSDKKSKKAGSKDRSK
jgi:post-segregation antitoxin (ccd killing protein)